MVSGLDLLVDLVLKNLQTQKPTGAEHDTPKLLQGRSWSRLYDNGIQPSHLTLKLPTTWGYQHGDEHAPRNAVLVGQLSPVRSEVNLSVSSTPTLAEYITH